MAPLLDKMVSGKVIQAGVTEWLKSIFRAEWVDLARPGSDRTDIVIADDLTDLQQTDPVRHEEFLRQMYCKPIQQPSRSNSVEARLSRSHLFGRWMNTPEDIKHISLLPRTTEYRQSLKMGSDKNLEVVTVHHMADGESITVPSPKPKRADITDEMVCGAYRDALSMRLPKRGYLKDKSPIDLLMGKGFPYKVVLAATERAYERGLIDVGTSIGRAWLTDKGRMLLDKADLINNQPQEIGK